MKRAFLIIICVSLIFALFAGCASPDKAQNAADYLIKTAGEPKTLSSAGDWAVFALARSGKLPEAWKSAYLASLKSALETGGAPGGGRNTEYSRAALILRALGEDPRDFADFDLLGPLEDFEKTSAQGVAGIAYALLALGDNTGGALRERYVEKLLEYQLSGGGFAPLGEDEPDADLTAICLQALALSRELMDVQAEIDLALNALAQTQSPDGGFLNSGAPTSESAAQVIIALCALGVSPGEDGRFAKGRGVYEALLAFRVSGGGFAHVLGGQANLLATAQTLCAMEALRRFENGEAPLYDFSDVGGFLSCKLYVRCDELLDNLSKLDTAKRRLVPENGVIFENARARFEPGESVFDLLKRELKAAGVHFEFAATPLTGGVYIEGIGNLYEFDAGELSGWFYSVNGEYPAVACSEYRLQDGDEIVFEYVLTMRRVSQ